MKKTGRRLSSFRKTILVFVCSLLILVKPGFSQSHLINQKITVASHEVFYRQAGSNLNPPLILLHGYPSSSVMFKGVIEKLATRFYVLAPDMPGFGYTEISDTSVFKPTFDNYAVFLDSFLSKLNIKKASFYLFDYSLPVIMRLLNQKPEIMDMLVFQNATMHKEGMGEVLIQTRKWLTENTPGSLKKYDGLFELSYTKWEYLNGTKHPEKIDPELYYFDQLLLNRPESKQFQKALKKDYKSNISLYEEWQCFIEAYQPKSIILWGERDEVFTKQAALKLHALLPESKLVFYPTGHFAIIEYGGEIAKEIINYYNAKNGQ